MMQDIQAHIFVVGPMQQTPRPQTKGLSCWRDAAARNLPSQDDAVTS